MSTLTKSSKSHEEFEDLEPAFERRLELFDRRKNHNKYWHIFVYDVGGEGYVVRHYGRHGGKGQWTVHRTWNAWGAEAAAHDLACKKLDKGYLPEANILDRFAREI